MALTTDSTTRNTDRPITQLGEAIEQIADHRIAHTGIDEIRFCEASRDLAVSDSPRPAPEVIWAD